MNGIEPDPSRTARRWRRTLQAIRRRVQGTVPPPGRFLLVVTPTGPSSASPLHVESGGERDGEQWALVDRGGEVVRRRGVPCLVTVHDLDEPDPELATVAWLHLEADGNVTTRPLGSGGPEGSPDMTETCSTTDAAMDPEAVFDSHKATAEPLDEAEVSAIVAAGLASADEFDMRGGGLNWYRPSWPPPEDEGDEDLPVVAAGDPCPACGGAIVVDGTVTYTRVPVLSDGTPTDEGGGGDFEFDGDPYCGDCGQRVQVGP